METTSRKYTFLPTPTTESNRNWTPECKWAVMRALTDPEETLRKMLIIQFEKIDADSEKQNQIVDSRTRVINKIRLFRKTMNERIRYMVHNWQNDSWMKSVLGSYFSTNSVTSMLK